MNNVNFNKEQKEAIEFHKGACGVVASAGSGKSTVLLNRISNLVNKHNVFEKNILAISFTRNTADELKKKLEKMGLPHVNVGTFHSICGGILHREGIHINGYNLVKEWQIDNCFKNIDKQADTKEIMSFISYQKNYGITPEDKFKAKPGDLSNKQYMDEMREYYRAYESMKTQKDLYDFDDYLLLCLDILKKNPGKYTYEYILVDEHQDSNKVQNELLQEWCESGNMFSLYDYRQAIFAFRGGTTEYSMNFENYWDNARIINIYTNYRSPKNIVDKSNEFIKKYYGQYVHYVDAKAHNQSNGHIQVDSRMSKDVEGVEVVDEIEKLISQGVDLNEIAVLYRNNAHADFVESELKRRGIEYDIANDSSFFKRREVAGLIAYLRLIHNTDDDSAFESIFRLRNEPMMYLSNQVFTKIANHAHDNDKSMFDSLSEVSLSKTWQKKNLIEFRNKINRLKRNMNEDEVITLINNIIDTFSMKKYILNKYINKEEREERMNSLEVLKSFVKGNNLEQFITYVYSNKQQKKKKENAVRLMTIHRSKGLEFDHVFLVGVQDGEFPHENAELLEEARLFYVAVTRSKKNLWISEIGRKNKFIEEYGYTESVLEEDESKYTQDVQKLIEEQLKWV